MADVKRFTGFIAIDGSTHTSAKAAIEHSRAVKIQNALKEKFGNLIVAEPVTTAEIASEDVNLADFIYANREAILAALNQEVLTRKKRGPNKPKAEAANEPAATVAA